MSSIESYKELITSIKSIGVDNVSPKDKQVLVDLLKTLKYIGEFRLLKQCYDKDKTIDSLVPFIDSKLMDLKSKLNALDEKLVETGELSEFEKIKNRALTVTYNRYAEIKKAIQTRNFDHYVDFMNNNLNSATQIIAICSSVLDQANVGYAKSFVINGNDKTAVDLIYDLKNMPALAHDLTVYFNRRKHYTVDNLEKVRADEQFMAYLDTIKNNEQLVRDFMEAVHIIGTSENDKAVVVRERLSHNKTRLAELNKNFLSSLKNTKEIAYLESEVEKDEFELRKIISAKEKFGFILSELDKIGLRPFADQFVSPTANIDDSIEQRVVNFVKTSMRKDRFDIRSVKAKIEEEIRLLNSQIVRKESILDESLKNISSYGQELIKKYPEETEHILDVVNGNVQGEVTPIFAAYALKALMDSKSLKVSSLNEIVNAYDQKGFSALVSSYEAIVKNTAVNVKEAIGEVTSRAIFDTSSFEQLKIK